MEYIAIATDRLGRVQDVALCNAYSLAKQEAEGFALNAPANAKIMVFECKEMLVLNGNLPEMQEVK